MNKILAKVSEEDAKELNDSIVETEACRELYQEATKRVDCPPEALRYVLDYYMQCLKVHKALWRRILVDYVGEETASTLYNILRFDTIKNVIFQIEIEGCKICKSN
jgi:hypothetical protein